MLDVINVELPWFAEDYLCPLRTHYGTIYKDCREESDVNGKIRLEKQSSFLPPLFHIHQQLDEIEVQNVKTAQRQCGGREGLSVLINMCISRLSSRSEKPKPSLT